MIISRSRGFVFIHVHKTAGESITKALAPHLGVRDVVLGTTVLGNVLNAYFHRRHRLNKHSAAVEAAAFLGDAWHESFTFSVVRNPCDRIRSLYHYFEKMLAKRHRGGLRTAALNGLPGLDYRDPLKWPEMQAFLETDSFSDYIRHPAFGPHQMGTRPQVASLCDARGRLLVDHVARFETLSQDFAAITRHLGLKGVTLGRHNASRNSAGGGAPLSRDDRAHLYALYREDFETFGYSRAAAA